MNRTFPLPVVLAVATLALVAGCDGGPSDPQEMSAEARAYLEAVVETMEAHAVVRHTIDWASFRSEVFGRAAGAQRISDTYPAIERALRLLQDHRSSFRTVEGTLLFATLRPCAAAVAEEPLLPPGIGYVRIGPFTEGSMDADGYLGSIQEELAERDGEDVIGWIVDLRGNVGGDPWVMLAGAGPVLGEGVVGYFVDADGGTEAWEYRDDAIWLNGAEMRRVAEPYRLLREAPRVAVLTDNRVIGEGEAVAIAFRGRPDARSFGQATCGVPLWTRRFTMSDGGILNLAVARMADRTGQVYADEVPPDEPGLGISEPVDRAVDWLQSEAD